MAMGIDHNPFTNTYGGAQGGGASGLSGGDRIINIGSGSAAGAAGVNWLHIALAVGAVWLVRRYMR